MLSRIFANPIYTALSFNSITLSSGFTFCTNATSRHDSHPLRSKIIDLITFDEFHNFFKDKNQQFDSSCYSIASRTLAKILIDSRMTFNFQQRQTLKFYLSHLEKLQLGRLHLTQFSHILFLLKVLRQDSNNNNRFANGPIRLILQRSEDKVKELEKDANINRLCYFYQQYCGLGSRATLSIARRINQLLKEQHSEAQSKSMAIADIHLILKGMRSKGVLPFQEVGLLKNIIKVILDKYFQELSFLELAQVSVSLNQILSNNPNEIHNNTNVEQIHKKVLQNIDQMDQKSIMYILNSKKTNNKTYNQIYRIIFDKILDEIQPNGDSSFNELFTLRLFNGISNKINLGYTSSENQQKFFAFLRQAITKTPRYIHSFVENYIEKGFFSYKHLLTLVSILQTITDFNFKLSLIYQLSVRRIDAEKIFHLDVTKEFQFKDKNLLMICAIFQNFIQKGSPNKEKYEQLLKTARAKFIQNYKVSDDSFANLIFYLDNRYLKSLYKTFRNDLGNPLQNLSLSERTTNAWIKFIVYGSTESSFNKKQMYLLKSSITQNSMKGILRMVITQKYFHPSALTNALSLVSKNLQIIFGQKDLEFSVSKLLTQQIYNIFDGSNIELAKAKFWFILNKSYQKFDTAKFLHNYSTILNSMLKSNLSDFKYSQQYKAFMQKLLNKAGEISSRFLVTEVIRQNLRLGLIRRQDLSKIPAQAKQNLYGNEALMLKMIQTNDFALQDVELTKQNLHLFLFNNSIQSISFLSKNNQKVLSLIQSMRQAELWRCITYYRLGAKRSQTELLDNIFKAFSKFNVYYEESNPIFVGEIFKRNGLEKTGFKVQNIKNFIRNALIYFSQKNKIYRLSLEDHVHLIKVANDMKIKNDEYIHTILDKFSDNSTIFYRQLFLTCGLIDFQLKPSQKQILVNTKNFFINFNASFSKAFTLFLLFEKQLENKSAILQKIIAKFNQIATTQKISIFSIYYQYLRKNYPEETKDFKPSHIDKADFCKNLESLNAKTFFTLRAVVQEVTKQKWEEKVVFDNYYYQFRNAVIVIPAQSKNHGQNNLIKRILQAVTGIDKVILLNRRSFSIKGILKYISINNPQVITTAEQQQIIKKIEAQQAQYKANQLKNEAEQEQIVQQQVAAEQKQSQSEKKTESQTKDQQ